MAGSRSSSPTAVYSKDNLQRRSVEQPWLEVIKQAKKKVEDAEKDLDDICLLAIRQGISYATVGEILGMTRQGARARFNKEETQQG